MAEEAKVWLDKAERDLAAASWNFKGKFFEESAFLCQQSVEKALKAMLLRKGNKIEKTHDLVFLAKKLNLPENFKENLKELTLAYIYSRYPDAKQEQNLEAVASKFLDWALEILKWIKEQI